MASDPITFVQWRGAKADPPEDAGWYLTDVGMVESYPSDGELWWQGDAQPTVWCDPRPPVESEHGPLTTSDLRALASPFSHMEHRLAQARARLRHAIEQQEVDRGN